MKAPSKISLVLGSHAHVPYGAEPEEFERVYACLLRPFLTGLYRHPRIQAALHYSGVLLHWIERAHHELFMLIEDMVSRRQAELLGGGFYEPILPMIPQQDKIGQIELLTTYIRRQFGRRPQGCWMPELAWEQGLVGPLASCGMGFTFLGERQLALAGASPDSPCICEDQGKLLTVFPVAQSMEEALAEKSVSALLEGYWARRQAGSPRRCARGQPCEAVVAIFPGRLEPGADAAAIGPGETPEHAWGRFFEELSLCEGFAETVGPGRLARRLKGLQRAYVPDSSGGAGAEPARRFVIERPEAGRLYSKMLFSGMMVGQLRGDKSRRDSAREELWKAQGSALFCRPGRQGLHDAALRGAAYGAMIGAERIARGAGRFAPSLLSYDFDMDGEDEWLFQEAKLNCYVQPLGGGVFELDYLPKAWNYMATCSGRLSFADRLLPAGASAEGLSPSAAGAGAADAACEAGARLCHGERYELAELDKARRRLRLSLQRPCAEGPPAAEGAASRAGGARAAGGAAQAAAAPFGAVGIEKTFALKKDAVSVRYSLANLGGEPALFRFAPEIDLSLPGETSAFARFYACRPGEADAALSGEAFPSGGSPLSGLAPGACGIKIHDLKNEAQIAFSASRPFDARIAPLRVGADGGPAGEAPGLFQAFCIMPLFSVSLEPGKSWEAELSLRFSH